MMARTLPTRLGMILALGALLGPALADGQTSLFFSPAQPTAGETFLALVSGEGHGCWEGGYDTTIEGNEVTLTFSDHCPIFVQPVDYLFRMEVTLPAGDWVVNAHNTFTDEIVTRELTVRPEPFVASDTEAGATLLFPYFEVDFDDPEGRTALVAIGNRSGAGTLARVVLWTDQGIPTLAFDLYVNGESVQTMNLRDVFSGNLPETPHGILVEPFPYPGCQSPIQMPGFSPATLRAKHSGQPAPGDGLCYSTQRGEGLLVGYLTVDVVTRCSTALPSSPQYFAEEHPIAGTRNVLWGDQFFVEGSQNSAQGWEPIAIPADVARATPGGTFYRQYAPSGTDARAMLPPVQLARASTEGTFDGGTDLLVWHEPTRDLEPWPCDSPPEPSCPLVLLGHFVAEQGSDAVEGISVLSPPVAARWSVGGPELPVTAPFTVGRLHVYDPTTYCELSPPPPGFDVQLSVTTVMRAFGRFSVGFRGIGLPE